MNADANVEYPRFRWLVTDKIAGAPHPDLFGGLKSVAPFLHANRVGGIVTLFDRPLEPNVESLGFGYLFAETPNFAPPPHLKRILEFVEEQVDQGKGVLVHCYAGIGRTGTVLAAWLLQQESKLGVAEAVAWVRDQYIPEYAQNRFPEHPSQLKALEDFAASR